MSTDDAKVPVAQSLQYGQGFAQQLDEVNKNLQQLDEVNKLVRHQWGPDSPLGKSIEVVSKDMRSLDPLQKQYADAARFFAEGGYDTMPSFLPAELKDPRWGEPSLAERISETRAAIDELAEIDFEPKPEPLWKQGWFWGFVGSVLVVVDIVLRFV